MLITVQNPVDQTDVQIDVQVVTNYITRPDGSTMLAVSANGSVEILPPSV